MGDVGAAGIGCRARQTIAVIVRQEMRAVHHGGVFVAETLSVMIQVLYSSGPAASGFSAWRSPSPLRLEGWKESQVVVRSGSITMMLVLFGLSTLKLR